jgi:hypothetical protein
MPNLGPHLDVAVMRVAELAAPCTTLFQNKGEAVTSC